MIEEKGDECKHCGVWTPEANQEDGYCMGCALIAQRIFEKLEQGR